MLLAFAVGIVSSQSPALAVGKVELVSRGAFPAPMPSDGSSIDARISADGRYVVFQSDATTFGVADTNGYFDIYVLDRTLSQFTLLSRAGAVLGNGPSANADVSADGNIVVFESDATNLVAGDTNGATDIFVLNRGTGVMRRLKPGASTESDGGSHGPQVSADGRYVAFSSAATNWTAGNDSALYVYDTQSDTVEVAALDSSGQPAFVSLDQFFNELDFSLSPNGRCVAFTSSDPLVTGDLNFFEDVFLRDLVAGTTVRVSVGGANQEGNGPSRTPLVTGACDRVAFITNATNLHPDGVVNFSNGALEKTLSSGAVTRIWPSVASLFDTEFAGSLAGSRNGASIAVAGGRAFFGESDFGFSVWRRSNGSLVHSPPSFGGFPTAVPDSGDFVVFDGFDPQVSTDLNTVSDISLFDVAGPARIAISLPPSPRIASSANGSSGVGERRSPLKTNGSTRNQFVSDDGLLVSFSSIATNLVAGGDTNGFEDVFVRDRRTGQNTRITRTPLGGDTNGDSAVTDFTADGRFIVIESCASNLVAGDTNGTCDVFVADRATNPATITRASQVNGGGQSAGPPPEAAVFLQGHWASISADGRYVAFASDASDLVANDTNGRSDIFLHDRQSLSTVLLTRGVGNTPTNGRSDYPRISADGRFVNFRSSASNLVPGATGSQSYVVDTTSLAMEIVSVDSEENFVSSGANRGFISADGRYVAYFHTDDNLVPNDTNGIEDVFVRDRLLGKTTRASLQPDGTQWPAATNGGTTLFIGGLSSRGLLVPFCISEGTGICNAGYSYNIATGKVDQLYTTPPGPNQALRLFASPNGLHVTLAFTGVLAANDENGRVSDVYLASDFTSTALGGAEGAIPELALAGAPEAGATMGDSVAISDEYVVSGAPGTNEVYVYSRPTGGAGTKMMRGVARAKGSGSFTLIATFSAPGGGLIGDKFGQSVAISPDGNTIAVGAPGVDAGQVVVFQKPPEAEWTDSTPPSTTINAPPASGNATPDEFGAAIDLAQDGRLVVGAPLSDIASQPDAGMVAVYAPQSGSYPTTASQTFQAPAPQNGAGFGMEVAATSTGAAVGAPLENDGTTVDAGAVYTYGSTSGAPYQTSATLRPPGTAGIGDKFGSGIGMDTGTLVIGAPGADTDAGADTGTGYVYESANESFGTAAARPLRPALTVGTAGVGTSVEVAGDYIVLGAPLTTRQSVTETGTALVFERPESGWNTLPTHLATIELRPSEAQANQLFGDSLALTTQGIVAGVPNRDVAQRPNQGEADTFVFDRIARGGFE